MLFVFFIFFFFNDTATTEIYTLSLHDALPISTRLPRTVEEGRVRTFADHAPYYLGCLVNGRAGAGTGIRDNMRSEEHSLNSSHSQISYAVFCLTKKNKQH